MNVLWQDNVPSFLDTSSLGSDGFAGSLGDVGAPWFASAGGGLFSGQPVLWWDNGADTTSSAAGLTGVGRFEPFGTDTTITAGGWIPNEAEPFSASNPTLDGGLLWPQAGGGTSGWLGSAGTG